MPEELPVHVWNPDNPAAKIVVFVWSPGGELLVRPPVGIEHVGRPKDAEVPLRGYIASQHPTRPPKPKPQPRQRNRATNFNSLRVIDCFVGRRHDHETGGESKSDQSHCEENPTDDRLEARKERLKDRPIQEHKSVAEHQCCEDQGKDSPAQTWSVDASLSWQAISPRTGRQSCRRDRYPCCWRPAPSAGPASPLFRLTPR